MITVTRGRDTVTRNVSFFKRVPRNAHATPEREGDRLTTPVGGDISEQLITPPGDRPTTEEEEGEHDEDGPSAISPELPSSPPAGGNNQRRGATRYNLRNDPQPSQRLRAYDLRS